MDYYKVQIRIHKLVDETFTDRLGCILGPAKEIATAGSQGSAAGTKNRNPLADMPKENLHIIYRVKP